MRSVRSLLLVLACTACTAGGAFPPPVIPPRPSVGDWPDAGAAVLNDVATLDYRLMHLRADRPPVLVAVLDHRRRIKILTEAGLRRATVDLPLDGYTTITSVVARSVSPDGHIRNMAPTAVHDIARKRGRRAPELKLLHFVVPGAEVGGLVEYRYKRVYTAPDLVPPWTFGDTMPVIRSEFGIITGAGIKVDYRYGHGEQMIDREPLRRSVGGGKTRLVFVERNLPPYYPEPRMPNLARVSPWVAPVVVSADIGRQRVRLQTWADVAGRVRAMLERVGGEPGVGSAESRYRQIRDSLQGLQLFGLGIRRPVAARGLLAGEPACSRDAAALLWKTLVGSPVNAYPALISSEAGPPLLEGFPGLYPFVRAVVAMDVTEQMRNGPSCTADPASRGLLCTVPPNSYAFLDPLCRNCRFGEMPTDLTGGRALVLVKAKPRWVDVPQDRPENNRLTEQFHYALQVDGTLQGRVSAEMVGSLARRVRRRLRGVDPPPRDQIIEQALFGTPAPGAQVAGTDADVTVTEPRVHAARNPDRPLKLMARLAGKTHKLDFQSFQVRPVDFAGSSLPGYWRDSRHYPAVLHAPAWVETVVAIDLPVGYDAETQDVVKIVQPFAEYAAGYALRDRTLSYSRRLVLKQHVIPTREWPAFRSFVHQVHQLERRGVKVWLPSDNP